VDPSYSHPFEEKAVHVRSATLFLAVVMSAALSTALAPTASAAPRCPDIEVVFARGTDEPAGIGRVGQALVDTLKPMVGKKSIGTYAVSYPASYDFLQAAAGATDASKRIQDTAAKCPSTKLVLGGYSQGAAVMDVVATSPIAGLGYNAPLPRAVVPRIAAIVVFGNPSARVGQPLTRMSPDFGARTADLCNTGDPICSLGQDFNAHVHYPESGLVTVAAKWVASHVQQGNEVSGA
jgi:cutinase